MVCDYAESNPFCLSSGSYANFIDWVYKCINSFTPNTIGNAVQQDATQMQMIDQIVISTDPPYYDNIGYADLSDFF
jgi:putative DNA methylase